MKMIDELCTLHSYALALRQINMLQVAGDLDYIVAWLKSPEWTGGPHLKPDPAGKNTVDVYSNNCPIPYTVCRKIVDCCTNLYTASGIINSTKSIIQRLLTIYTSEVEQVAIKAYLDYIDDLIYLIDGSEPGPEPPIVHTLNIVSPDKAIGESCEIKALYDNEIVTPIWNISPDGPTISGNIITFTEDGSYTITATYKSLSVNKQIEFEYKPGWSTETVIDESGDYPIANTTTTDPDGNKESEIVTYIDGEPVNTGFELEPGSEDGTIAIDEGKDTKIYTFDGTNGFELFFKFHYDPSLQPPPDYADKPGETDTVKHYTLLNMKYEVSPYPGIAVRNNQNSDKIQVSITPLNPADPTKPTVYVDFNFTSDGIYDMYMRYEPSAPFEKFVIIDSLTGNVKTRFEHYTYEFSNDVTTTLGYVNAGTVEEPIPCRQCIFDVYDFRLNKIMNPWKDAPTITETATHNGLLITKEITNDESHFVKRLLIEPDPNTSSDEYVLLDDGLVFDDILPFIDSDQVFELEFDVKVSYEDQIPYNGQYQVLINMIPEIQNHWPGFCVRLASEARPTSTRPNGAVDFRLRYTNDRDVYNNSLKVNALFDIDEDHVMHYRYIYEGTAIRKCSALYSYKTDAYRIFTGNALYAVYPHDWPLCIGCALDENRQKSRVCKMYVKKIEYIRNIR